jgi:hypothetical protein
MCNQLEQLKKEHLSPGPSSLVTARTIISSSNNNSTSNNYHHPHNVGGRDSVKKDGVPKGSRLARSRSNHIVEEMASDLNDDEEGDALHDSGSSGGSLPANREWEVLALHISPDLGERVMLSGERTLIEEAFPATGHAVMDARSTVAWHHDARHVIRFPLNGYCKLNSVQAITKLLNMGYRISASHGGGGVDSQPFSEYLFTRKSIPM